MLDENCNFEPLKVNYERKSDITFSLCVGCFQKKFQEIDMPDMGDF